MEGLKSFPSLKANLYKNMNRGFALSIAGALMEHFLERTTLVHLHQCIVLILRKRSKLNEETLFMS